MHISATARVTVACHVVGGGTNVPIFNPEVYSLKGKRGPGTEYIAMKGLQGGIGDPLFITGLRNGTTILHNGATVVPVNAGETRRVAVGTPASYIQTNFPVAIWQIGISPGVCKFV